MTYYKAKHILLEDEEDALEVLDMLNSGKAFEQLAEEFSECESSSKGGNLGRFKSGTMVAEFERALYHLKDGEVSKPVKTEFGYHLILRLPLK